MDTLDWYHEVGHGDRRGTRASFDFLGGWSTNRLNPLSATSCQNALTTEATRANFCADSYSNELHIITWLLA